MLPTRIPRLPQLAITPLNRILIFTSARNLHVPPEELRDTLVSSSLFVLRRQTRTRDELTLGQLQGTMQCPTLERVLVTLIFAVLLFITIMPSSLRCLVLAV